MKKLLILFTTLLVFVTFKSKIFAAESMFSSSYETYYDISENGITQVTSQVTLTNQTENYYASTYLVDPGYKKIYDVAAYDRFGNCQTTLEGPQIKVTFNDKVVGLNNSLKWSLTYKTSETAIKKGLIWEVNLPKTPDSPDILNYQTILKVPKSFGAETGLTQKSSSISESSDKLIYTFSKDTTQNSGISASFGDFQVFNYTLKYHLKNQIILPRLYEIALPPSIDSRQETYIQSINPKPFTIKIDPDGNYIARYFLLPGQELAVELTGSAKVFNKQINTNLSKQLSPVTPSLAPWTKSQPFWETEDNLIKKTVLEITNQNLSTTANARLIYDFVLKTLSYNDQKGFDNRLGAATVLKDPKNAVCGEFADLFVTLCRTLGIPSRTVEGYAATGSNRPLAGDVLHAWAEYFDQSLGWVPVDPTWGNTAKSDYFSKLDTNHLAFVRHGLSSIGPAPAGAYKLDTNEKDQVSVSFGDSFDTPSPRIVATQRHQILGGVKLSVHNPTGLAITNTLTGQLPPFSHISINLSKPIEKLIYFDFSGRSYQTTVAYERVNWWSLATVGVGSVGAIVFTILIIRKKFPNKTIKSLIS